MHDQSLLEIYRDFHICVCKTYCRVENSQVVCSEFCPFIAVARELKDSAYFEVEPDGSIVTFCYVLGSDWPRAKLLAYTSDGSKVSV